MAPGPNGFRAAGVRNSLSRRVPCSQRCRWGKSASHRSPPGHVKGHLTPKSCGVFTAANGPPIPLSGHDPTHATLGRNARHGPTRIRRLPRSKSSPTDSQQGPGAIASATAGAYARNEAWVLAGSGERWDIVMQFGARRRVPAEALTERPMDLPIARVGRLFASAGGQVGGERMSSVGRGLTLLASVTALVVPAVGATGAVVTPAAAAVVSVTPACPRPTREMQVIRTSCGQATPTTPSPPVPPLGITSRCWWTQAGPHQRVPLVDRCALWFDGARRPAGVGAADNADLARGVFLGGRWLMYYDAAQAGHPSDSGYDCLRWRLRLRSLRATPSSPMARRDRSTAREARWLDRPEPVRRPGNRIGLLDLEVERRRLIPTCPDLVSAAQGDRDLVHARSQPTHSSTTTPPHTPGRQRSKTPTWWTPGVVTSCSSQAGCIRRRATAEGMRCATGPWGRAVSLIRTPS